MIPRALLFAAALACGCHRPAASREPDSAYVESLADPYASLPPRGSVPAADRAAAILDAVGGPLGLGTAAGDGLRAHEGEAWARRLALLVDHGGDAQLEAAWKDLLEGTVQASRLDAEAKLAVRQAEARVLDQAREDPSTAARRRRLLAEIARTTALFAASR